MCEAHERVLMEKEDAESRRREDVESPGGVECARRWRAWLKQRRARLRWPKLIRTGLSCDQLRRRSLFLPGFELLAFALCLLGLALLLLCFRTFNKSSDLSPIVMTVAKNMRD